MTSRALSVLLCILAASGVGGSAQAQPYERTVQDTVSFAPKVVTVENRGGSIAVSTWTQDRVAYSARIVSRQGAGVVEDAAIDVDQFNQKLSLASNYDALEPRWSFGPEVYGYGVAHPDVHYTVRIPDSSALHVRDEDSDIQIDGLASALQVRTEEGTLRVSNQRGPVEIDAEEGTTSLTDVDGDLMVDTREGTLSVEALKGRLVLDTREGGAEVSIDSLAAVDVENHEGVVRLTVPADAGFDLATNIGGDAVLESPLSQESVRSEGGDAHGSVQGGGPLVHLTSQEGKIILRRR